MMSKSFGAAMNIHEPDLGQGGESDTIGEAVEVPMGVSWKKVEFILSRGTPRDIECL